MAASPVPLTRLCRLWQKERCSTIRMPSVTTMAITTGKDTSVDITTGKDTSADIITEKVLTADTRKVMRAAAVITESK